MIFFSHRLKVRANNLTKNLKLFSVSFTVIGLDRRERKVFLLVRMKFWIFSRCPEHAFNSGAIYGSKAELFSDMPIIASGFVFSANCSHLLSDPFSWVQQQSNYIVRRVGNCIYCLQTRAVHVDACVDTWQLRIHKLVDLNNQFIYHLLDRFMSIFWF